MKTSALTIAYAATLAAVAACSYCAAIMSDSPHESRDLSHNLTHAERRYLKAMSDHIQKMSEQDWCDESDIGDSIADKANELRKLLADDIDLEVNRTLGQMGMGEWTAQLRTTAKRYAQMAK